MRVIEFVGEPGAGKSTQIAHLQRRCEAKGQLAIVTSDRERITRIETPPSERMMFGVLIAVLAVEVYHGCLQVGRPPDFLFLDRGWNDVPIWAEFECGRKSISSQERMAMKTLFASYAKRVERTVYLSVPPELSLERHQGREHLPCDDLAMQPDFLKGLHKAYQTHWYKMHHPYRVDGRQPEARINDQLIEILKL